MTELTAIEKSETHNLANKVAGRYGRLALTRAAGEAAMAERNGDHEAYDLWASVIAYIRRSIQQEEASVTA